MLSVIVYGRNDSHGYNLHKRAAISLNCIAETLRAPFDEIIFVDYNSPDELPTFPEAIQDTLTDNARDKIRILRVRSSQHQRFAHRSHLNALEPVARNVAIRRSNAENRWILSTNTDMIFVPRRGWSGFDDILSGLPDGFYHLPRFELPEGVWESFNRLDPVGTIAATRKLAADFHLNEIAYTVPVVIYDAPGDFQLVLREDLLKIQGFDENMILGWHVDTNLAKRLGILRGSIGTLTDRLAGYHCDHTRVATILHGNERIENNLKRFVDDVTIAELPDQEAEWGLGDATVEEISLRCGTLTRYLGALSSAIEASGTEQFTEAYCNRSTFNGLEYDANHVLPFVLDALSCAPPGARVGYAGARSDVIQQIFSGTSAMVPDVSFLTLDWMDWLQPPGAGAFAAFEEWVEASDIFVFEIGVPPGSEPGPAREYARRSARVVGVFLRVARTLRRDRPVRVVAINSIHNAFEQHVWCNVRSAVTPFSSRVRHGYFAPTAAPRLQDRRLAPWLGCFGDTGPRDAGAVERMALLAGIDQAITIGGGRDAQRILFLAPQPDRFASILSSIGMDVDVADPRHFVEDRSARDWRPNLDHERNLVPQPLGIFTAGKTYDFIVCPQIALRAVSASPARFLDALADCLNSAGLLALSLGREVAPDGIAREAWQAALSQLLNRTLLLDALHVQSPAGDAFDIRILQNVDLGARLDEPIAGRSDDDTSEEERVDREISVDLGVLDPGRYIVNLVFHTRGMIPTVPAMTLRVLIDGAGCVSHRQCLLIELEQGEMRHAFQIEARGACLVMLRVAGHQSLEIMPDEHGLFRLED